MRIIVTILLFFSLVAQGQYTKHIITSGTGYSTANNIKMAFGVHIPPDNPNGQKHMIFIFLHGQGERGARGDTTTSNGIVKVANVGLPRLIKTTDIGYWAPPGGTSDQARGVIVIFPQCSTEYGAWPVAYESEMIKWAKANLSTVGDTNMIVVTGLSQGGGGTLGGMGDLFCNQNTSFRVSICPGYYAYTNRQQVANWGQPVWIFHSVNDPTASIINPNGMVNSTNFFKPVHPIQYIRFSGVTTGTVGHNIWDSIYTTNKGSQYQLSNGDTYIHEYTIYELAAQYTKRRPKRGDLWLLLLLPIPAALIRKEAKVININSHKSRLAA